MAYINHIISTKNERLTSGFGLRPNPTGAGTEKHYGADYVDAQGLQTKQDVGILAVAGGTVVEYIIGDQVGYTVGISHEGRIFSRYQHMKAGSVKVKVGDKVTKGQQIGIMGTTGRSTGIHLHFAIKTNSTSYSNGTWVDPVPYLTGEKNIEGDNLMSKEYEELKKDFESISNKYKEMEDKLNKWTNSSRIKFNYIDNNMPEWARATVTKMTQNGFLKGDEKGNLQLSEDMLRLFVVMDRAKVFN